VEAVIRFQGRHGLAQDGIIGAKTFAALNTPPADRLRQIGLTLERWRWMPDDLGHRPLVINVPEFRLYAFEPAPDGGYRLALNMDVIVGKSFPRFQTPVFRGDMSYLVFSPFWNVPESIQRRELAPRIAEDPAYLADNHFQIVASYALSAEPLPADSANLERVLAGELKLRQAPGPDNALGVAKFMFPNNHAVYLHGTPAMGLFSKDKRDFSHGCIRIADPPRLAAYVLSQEPGWDRARVDAVIADGERRAVSLSRALAVFVLYGTAVVEPNGPVRFFQDIYGHDRRLEKALALKR
jgi:murein L,D-transpeptidase YcbB/YkuD